MADTAASKTVLLDHDISINGVRYNAGRQEVPAEVADDLVRMNSEFNQHVANLSKKNVYERNMGSLAAGGGA